jgi:hypothetical protein
MQFLKQALSKQHRDVSIQDLNSKLDIWTQYKPKSNYCLFVCLFQGWDGYRGLPDGRVPKVVNFLCTFTVVGTRTIRQTFGTRYRKSEAALLQRLKVQLLQWIIKMDLPSFIILYEIKEQILVWGMKM